jgi:peptidoglycan hydrolase-like protein with peptidoglycan-binding domain
MSSRHSHLARRTFLLGTVGGLAVTAVGTWSASAAASPMAAPSISGTSAWGAREASGTIEVRDAKPSKIIVHHTATPNSEDTSQSHAFALARDIQNFHMDSNGWIDTGQNFTNSRGGHLMEGRHKSLAALGGGTQHVVGAHAGDQNSVALGIENEGTYGDASVPDGLWQSLVKLCSYMASQYGIAASAIYGHRDFMSTECPGNVLYGKIPDLRQQVASTLGLPVAHPATWPLLQPGATGARVTAAQHLFRAQGAQAVPVDGVFGPDTQRAAGDFLAAHRFEAASCYATRVAEPGLFGGTAWTALAPVLGTGASGDAVRAAQLLLNSRGHHVAADARFEQPTVSAVRDFQSANGLAPNGVVDHETWLRLLQ